MKINVLNFFKKAPLSAAEKLERKNRRVLAIIAGILLGIAFPPFPFPYLNFTAIIPLLMILETRKKLIDINKAAYLMGFVMSLITLYWVGAFTVHKDPFLMIGGGLLLFINPIFFLIPTTLYFYANKHFGKNAALFLFPVFWAAYEYFYMSIDAAFPWVTLSHAVIKFNHFIQIADIIGSLGLTLLIVYINILFYKSLTILNKVKLYKNYYFITALLLIFLPVLYGIVRLNTFKISSITIRAGLIQPNLDPYDKWAGLDIAGLTDKYLDQSQKVVREGAQVVIYPETALPAYLLLGQYDSEVAKLRKFVDTNGVAIISGIPDAVFYKGNDKHAGSKPSTDGTYRFSTFNSVMLINPKIYEIQKYGKIKLVPFGERTPYLEKIDFLSDLFKWGVGISSWNVGTDTTVFNLVISRKANNNVSTLIDTVKMSSIVCYESIFPYYVSEFTNKGAKFFAIVTNDSWYGNTSGPYQHRDMSKLRAIENRRSFVRAANGGISCLIDAKGEIHESTNMFEKTQLTVDVPLENEKTIFVQTALLIPMTVSLISGAMILFSFLAYLKFKLKIGLQE